MFGVGNRALTERNINSGKIVFCLLRRPYKLKCHRVLEVGSIVVGH
jgi:hypothetical protein